MEVMPPSRRLRSDLIRAVARGELGLDESGSVISRIGQRIAPLSFSQARLWFLDQLEPNSTTYICPLALRLTGCLDESTLQATLSEIVRRHEVLRTTFTFIDGTPMQTVQDASPVPLPVVELQALSREEREQEAQRRIYDEAQQSFDLESG